MEHTLKDLRKELKAAGYRLKTKRHADFISADILTTEGGSLGGMFASKAEVDAYREQHATAFAIRNKYKGNTFDDLFRVVLS